MFRHTTTAKDIVSLRLVHVYVQWVKKALIADAYQKMEIGNVNQDHALPASQERMLVVTPSSAKSARPINLPVVLEPQPVFSVVTNVQTTRNIYQVLVLLRVIFNVLCALMDTNATDVIRSNAMKIHMGAEAYATRVSPVTVRSAK